MSISKENLKPAESLQMGEIMSREISVCGNPLKFSIRISFAEIIPPIYILTVEYEGKIASHNFQLGQSFHWEFEVSGPLGVGNGVLISLSNWEVFGAQESAALKFVGYSALTLCSPVVERIDF